eukprot:19211-Heterococcus_DN1.PRE.4
MCFSSAVPAPRIGADNQCRAVTVMHLLYISGLAVTLSRSYLSHLIKHDDVRPSCSTTVDDDVDWCNMAHASH